MAKVDIIIPTTFDTDYVNWLLNSMNMYKMGADYEVMVVDNLSQPVFKRDGIKSIRFEERLFFARAMNEGIKATKNEYVLLLNNDTGIAHDNFLGNLLETLNSEENIGIVSPMCNFISPDVAKCETKEKLPNKIIKHNGHVAAVCWLLKRSTIEDVGLFDEQFVNSHCDSDYAERVLRKGYKVYIDGRVWLFHYGSRTVSRTPGYYEEFGKNSNRFHQKWKI